MDETQPTQPRSPTKSVAVWVVIGGVLAAAAVGLVAMRMTADPAAQPAAPTSQTAHTTYSNVADMQAHDPFYVAHRGGSATWPEMSITAYTQATEYGIGAIEVSVARTKDGKFFGLHDRTLDRTSKVPGGVDPANLTWAELTAKYQNKLNSKSPEGEPYTLASDIFEKFANDHVIFVDPKYIGDEAARTELIEQMLSYAPADHWVLKGYYDNTALATAARDADIQSWGYYYARDLDKLDSTVSSWDMLGLELNASAAQFASVKAKGKPVIAFFITDQATLAQARAKGATGMMISNVPATLGKSQTPALN